MNTSNTETMEAYRQWLQSWTSSAATVASRSKAAASRLREWGGPDGITTERIEEWLSSYQGWSRTTYYQHIKSFCTWLYLTSRIETNPVDDIKPPRQPKSMPRPLSQAQAQVLLNAAQGHERTWLLLALYQGLRSHEIAKVRGSDFADGMLFVLGKGGKPAYLPINAEVAAVVPLHPNGYWFPGARGRAHISAGTVTAHITRLFRQHGIDEGSLHRCRHSFGTNLVRSGVHVRKVQNLMRHESLTTTAVYTALDEEELRDAINRLPPAS